jgi:hypothetical protein
MPDFGAAGPRGSGRISIPSSSEIADTPAGDPPTRESIFVDSKDRVFSSIQRI